MVGEQTTATPPSGCHPSWMSLLTASWSCAAPPSASMSLYAMSNPFVEWETCGIRRKTTWLHYIFFNSILSIVASILTATQCDKPPSRPVRYQRLGSEVIAMGANRRFQLGIVGGQTG